MQPQPPPSQVLRRQLGDIDIYLFDQIVRGRFDDRPRLLDAGCGGGRNLVWFLQSGYDVCALDRDPAAVAVVRELAAQLAPSLPAANIREGALDALPWPAAGMDAVLSSAVLHFAMDEGHFGRMVEELWRVLRPGGLLFARLASSIGIEHLLPRAAGRVRLPDGSDRFVVSEPMLLEWSERLGGDLIDPIKTTNVQGLRCMTTWCLTKRVVEMPTVGNRPAAGPQRTALHAQPDPVKKSTVERVAGSFRPRHTAGYEAPDNSLPSESDHGPHRRAVDYAQAVQTPPCMRSPILGELESIRDQADGRVRR